MVIVLDSEYVFKGIMEWSAKWRRPVEDRVRGGGPQRSLGGNTGAPRAREGASASGMDPVPCFGGGKRRGRSAGGRSRLQHPNNRKRRRTEPAWEALGLVPMDLDGSSTNEEETNTSSMGGPSGMSIVGRSQGAQSSGSKASLSSSDADASDSDTDRSRFSHGGAVSSVPVRDSPPPYPPPGPPGPLSYQGSMATSQT